jgi:exodeoxyribonuclease-3
MLPCILVKLATWNVNSIRARQERVIAWIQARRPDVLCLQELKVEDDKFPAEAFRALGYEITTFGQKTYNGVAILSREPLLDVERGITDGVDDAQARFLAGTTQGLRVLCCYVPNGEAVRTDKFTYKMAWLERLRAYLAPRVRPEVPLALCGDFNIAPAPEDVYDPVAWEGQCLYSLEERAALGRIREVGLIDVIRHVHPIGPLYTYWDYRMLAFPKNRGLRIDHVFVTPSLLERVTTAWVDREERKGKQPSDHAPVLVEFKD